MNFIRKLLGDTFIYGVATVLPKVANVVLVKLHTGFFLPDQYAISTNFYIYAAYLNVVLTLGMETTFFKFFNAHKNEQSIIISNCFSLLLTTSIIFIGLVLLFSKDIAIAFDFKSETHIKLLGLTIFFDTLSVIPFAYLRAFGKSRHFFLIKILNTVLYVSINILLLWTFPNFLTKMYPNNDFFQYFLHPDVTFIFIANVIASLGTFFLLIPILIKIRVRLNLNILKKMIRYSLPIVGSGLAYITIENIDKIFLNSMIGESEMGVYAACYKIGIIINVYILSFRLGAEPLFFEQADKKNAKRVYAFSLKWFFIFGAFIYLISVCFIDKIAMVLLGNSSYYDALYIAPIILLSNLFFGGYLNLSIWYKINNKTLYGMYFAITGAFLTIILNYYFIPFFGFLASAFATLISYASMFLISYFVGQKHYKVSYNMKSIFFYITISVTLAYLSLSTNTLWLKIGMCMLFFIMVLFVNRRDIMSLLFTKG